MYLFVHSFKYLLLRDSQQPKLESEINYWVNNHLEDGDDDEEDGSNYDPANNEEHHLKNIPRNNLKNFTEEHSSRSISSKSLSCYSSSAASASASAVSHRAGKPSLCVPSAAPTAEGHVRQVVSSQGCSRMFIVKGNVKPVYHPVIPSSLIPFLFIISSYYLPTYLSIYFPAYLPSHLPPSLTLFSLPSLPLLSLYSDTIVLLSVSNYVRGKSLPSIFTFKKDLVVQWLKGAKVTVHTHMHIYMCMYLYIYVCIYFCTCTHTYTNTY